MKKQGILALLSLLAFTPAVFANEIAVKEDNGDIYLSGLPSYQSIQAVYNGIPKVQKKTSNECGFIKLTSSTSTPINLSSDSITFNSNSYALGSVPVSSALTCSNGVLGGTVSGIVQKDGNAVYITGLSPYTDYQVGFNNIPVTRSIKANTCGIAKLSNTDTYNNSAGTIVIKNRETGVTIGTLPAFASIPEAGGPVCRRGTGFFPVGFPTSSNF
ncbi:hypothetical protein GM3709_702 [Geminocystis sp. NIES-3709]|nr:hypothetical protein GM3709_702 [Geminocystis sp. NIES-3709]